MGYEQTIEKYQKALTAAQKKRLQKQYEDLTRSYADEVREADVARAKGIATGRNQLANIGLSGNNLKSQSGEVDRLKGTYNRSADATVRQAQSAADSQNNYLGAQLYNQTVAARNAAAQQAAETYAKYGYLLEAGVPEYTPDNGRYTEAQYYALWAAELQRRNQEAMLQADKAAGGMRLRYGPNLPRPDLIPAIPTTHDSMRNNVQQQAEVVRQETRDLITSDDYAVRYQGGIRYLRHEGYSEEDATQIAKTVYLSTDPAAYYGLNADEAARAINGEDPLAISTNKVQSPAGRMDYARMRARAVFTATYGMTQEEMVDHIAKLEATPAKSVPAPQYGSSHSGNASAAWGYYNAQQEAEREKAAEIQKYRDMLAAYDSLVELYLYESYTLNPDYKEKSQYDEQYIEQNNLYDKVNNPTKPYDDFFEPVLQRPEKIYEQLTEQELGIFNYLYATKGEQVAEVYIEKLESELESRQIIETQNRYHDAIDNAMQNSNWLGKVGLNILSVPLTIAEDLNNFALEIRNGKNGYGETDIPHYHGAQIIREGTGEAIEEGIGGYFGKLVNQFGYQPLMSALDSAARVAMFGPKGALAVSFAGAYSSTVDQARATGMGEDEAQLLGLIAGCAEVFFEKFSIDSFVKMSHADVKGAILKNVFKQGGIEALEEMATEFANQAANLIIAGDYSNYNQYVQDYRRQGYSEDEAKSKAWLKIGGEILESGISGFMSGGFMGTGSTVYSNAALKRSNAQVASYYTSSTQALTELLDEGSKTEGKASELASNINAAFNKSVEAEIEKGNTQEQAEQQALKNISSTDVAALIAELEKAEIKRTLANNNVDAKTQAAYSAILDGKTLSVQQAELIANNPTAAELLRTTMMLDASVKITAAQVRDVAPMIRQGLIHRRAQKIVSAYASSSVNSESTRTVEGASESSARARSATRQTITYPEYEVDPATGRAVLDENGKPKLKEYNQTLQTLENKGGADNGGVTVSQTGHGRTEARSESNGRRTEAQAQSNRQGNESVKAAEPKLEAYEVLRSHGWDRESARSLEQYVNDSEAETGSRAVPKPADEAALTEEQRQRVANVRKLLKGKRIRVYFYTDESGFAGGYTSGGAIYLDAMRPDIEFLASHEAAHNNAAYIAKMQVLLLNHADKVNKWMKAFNRDLVSRGYPMRALAFDEAATELACDVFAALETGNMVNRAMGLTIDELTELCEAADEIIDEVGENYSGVVSEENVRTIQGIGRQSVNEFSEEQRKNTETFEARHWRELGVKSPFFRASFGDWRAYDTTPVQTVEVESTDLDLREIHSERGTFENKDTSWEIVSGALGESETKHYGRQTRKSVQMLRSVNKILNAAVLLDSYASARDSKSKHSDTAFMHKLYAPVIHEGKSCLAVIRVEEFYPDGNAQRRLYHLRGIEIEPADNRFDGDADLSNASTTDSIPIKTVSDLFEVVKQWDKGFKPKAVDPELLNEDGTPKQTYYSADGTSLNGQYSRRANMYAEAAAAEISTLTKEEYAELVASCKNISAWALKDMSRVLDAVSNKSRRVRDVLANLIEKPFDAAEGEYGRGVTTKTRTIKEDLRAMGIKKPKQSKAIQRIGEGHYQHSCDIEIRRVENGYKIKATDKSGTIAEGLYTRKELKRSFGEYGDYAADAADAAQNKVDKTAVIRSLLSPYTEQMLKADHPNDYENIMRAERYMRKIYDEYIAQINDMLEQVYPHIYEEFEASKERLQQRIDEAELKLNNQHTLIGRIEERIQGIREQIAAKKRKDTQVYADLQNSLAHEQRRKQRAISLAVAYAAKRTELQAKLEQFIQDDKNGLTTRNKRLLPRNDYFHHFREMEAGVGGLRNILRSNTEISPALVGISSQTKPKSRWAEILQRRNGGWYTEDAVKGMLKYVSIAEYILAYDPLIAHLRNVEKEITQAAVELENSNDASAKNANTLKLWLRSFTNTLCGKSHDFDRMLSDAGVVGRKFIKALLWWNNRVKSNTLLLNVRNSIVQFSNLTNAVTFIRNPLDWIKGSISYIQMIKSADMKEIFSKSNFMSQRLMKAASFDSGLEAVIKSPYKFACWVLSAGDTFSSTLTWWSAYNQYLRNPEAAQKGGFRSYDSAIDYADDVTRRSHGGRGVGELPSALSSQIVNFFAPFQVEVLNTFNNLKQQLGKKNVVGIINMQLGIFVVNTITRALFGDGVLGFDFIQWLIDTITHAVDDEEEPADDVWYSAKRFGGELISGVPFAAQLAALVVPDDDVRETIFGESDPTRYGTGTLGANALVDMVGLVKDTIEGKAEWTDALDVFGAFLPPYGGKQLARTVRGINTVAKGYGSAVKEGGEIVQFPVDGDWTEYLQAGIFGKWSLPEAREYLKDDNAAQVDLLFDLLGHEEGNYSALSPEASQDYKEAVAAGIDGKDWYRIRDTLKSMATYEDENGGSISKAEQQRLYLLDRTDLTVEQKLMLDRQLIGSREQTYITKDTALYKLVYDEETGQTQQVVVADYRNRDWMELSQTKFYEVGRDIILSAKGATVKDVLEYANMSFEATETQTAAELREQARLKLLNDKSLTPDDKARLDVLMRSGSGYKAEGARVLKENENGELKVVADYSSAVKYEITANGWIEKAENAAALNIPEEMFVKYAQAYSALDPQKNSRGETVKSEKVQFVELLLEDNNLSATQRFAIFLYTTEPETREFSKSGTKWTVTKTFEDGSKESTEYTQDGNVFYKADGTLYRDYTNLHWYNVSDISEKQWKYAKEMSLTYGTTPATYYTAYEGMQAAKNAAVDTNKDGKINAAEERAAKTAYIESASYLTYAEKQFFYQIIREG